MLKSKDVKTIFAVLKRAGVEIEDKAKLESELGELQLEAEGSIPDGMKLITQENFGEIMGDLVKLRRKKNELKDQIEELETSGAGSSGENETLKDENAKLSKLVESYLKPQREKWAELVKSIPENLVKYYKAPGKGEDGEPIKLTDEEILANLSKHAEHVDTKAITPKAGPPPGGPRIPPAGGDGDRGDDKVYGKDAAKKMGTGYGPMPSNVK